MSDGVRIPPWGVRDPPEPLKVLHLIDSLGQGGAESSLVEMLPAFRKAGIEISVALLGHSPGPLEAAALASGTPVEVLGGRGIAPQVLALRRRLRVDRPDLLHTTLFRADLVGRMAAWGTGVVVLASLVNTTYDPIRLADPGVSRGGLALRRAVDSWTAGRLVDHFHAITHAVKEAAVRDLGIAPERITVIERGRDAERLGLRTELRRKRVRAALGIGDKERVVVHVGRHAFQKGQRYLLEAMDRLAAIDSVVLLLVGPPGSMTADLHRRAASLKRPDRVRFLGSRGDVLDVLAGADVFVFPSLYEGLGGSLIEAMGLELPVIASDLPATREILEDGRNAILVEPGSVAQLAVALDTLIEDPERAMRMGRRSRVIYESRFRLESVVERMVQLYRELGGGAA